MEQNKKVAISIKTPDYCEEMEGTFLVGVIAAPDSGETGLQGKSFLVGGGVRENAIAVVAMLDLIKAEVMQTFAISDSDLPKGALEMCNLKDKSIERYCRQLRYWNRQKEHELRRWRNV